MPAGDKRARRGIDLVLACDDDDDLMMLQPSREFSDCLSRSPSRSPSPGRSGDIGDFDPAQVAPPAALKAHRSERKKPTVKPLGEVGAFALFGKPSSGSLVPNEGSLTSPTSDDLNTTSAFPTLLAKHRQELEGSVENILMQLSAAVQHPTASGYVAVVASVLEVRATLCKAPNVLDLVDAFVQEPVTRRNATPISLPVRAQLAWVVALAVLHKALPSVSFARLPCFTLLRRSVEVGLGLVKDTDAAATSASATTPGPHVKAAANHWLARTRSSNAAGGGSSRPTSPAPAAASDVKSPTTASGVAAAAAGLDSYSEAERRTMREAIDHTGLADLLPKASGATAAEGSSGHLPRTPTEALNLLAVLSAALLRDIIVCANDPDHALTTAASRDAVAGALAEAGVWSCASAALRRTDLDASAVRTGVDLLLQAIEASTCVVGSASSALRGLSDPSHLFDATVDTFCRLGQRATASNKRTDLHGEHQRVHLLTKLLLNLSTAYPLGIPSMTPRLDDVAEALSRQLSAAHDTNDTDAVALLTCLALNFVTVRPPAIYSDDEDDDDLRHSSRPGETPNAPIRQRQHVNPEVRRALVRHAALVPSLCEILLAFHGANAAVERNVAGGYIAMLLAALTLRDEESRLTVVRALASQLSTRTVKDPKLAARPLRYVAAVVQEFVLFQSQAGILTQQTLVVLHRISSELLAENGGDPAEA